MQRRFGYLLLFGALAVAGWQAAHYHGQLPERVASHFDGAGHPNGWMTRDGFLALQLGLAGFLAMVFLLTGNFVNWLPVKAVNLPNKTYWLDPVRRVETCAYIAEWSHCFGALTITLIVGINQLVIAFNIYQTERLSPFIWVLLTIFLVVSVAMAATMFLRFRKVPSQ